MERREGSERRRENEREGDPRQREGAGQWWCMPLIPALVITPGKLNPSTQDTSRKMTSSLCYSSKTLHQKQRLGMKVHIINVRTLEGEASRSLS